MVAFLTRMDHPIGHGIGNALEVADAIRGLNNLMADDLRELVVKEGNQHSFIKFPVGVVVHALCITPFPLLSSRNVTLHERLCALV